jgi:hypothetical protein
MDADPSTRVGDFIAFPLSRLLDTVTRQGKISQRLHGSQGRDREGNSFAQFSTRVEHPIASASLSSVFYQYE